MANRPGRSGASDERGFTLLEVLIAMAIMVLALSSILAVESGSINASARAKQMNIVGMLAKSKMVEAEQKFEGKKFDEVKKDDGGEFPDPYKGYRWTMTVKEVEFPNLSGLMGGGDGSSTSKEGGGEMGSMMAKLISQFLSKAMREVTVTIFWKKGGGEQSFSVSTYWVDLNHEFQLTQ